MQHCCSARNTLYRITAHTYTSQSKYETDPKTVLDTASQQTYINSYQHTFYQQNTELTCWIKPQASAILELVVLYVTEHPNTKFH